jgi:hypothetical protein
VERRERLKICNSAYLYDVQFKTLERKGNHFHDEAITIIIAVVIVGGVVVFVVVDSYAFESEHNYIAEQNSQRILMPSAIYRYIK